ncbi:DUF421 domain-containing protein [Rubeoparvulum massiliense]|uniref:DUF421 domain-containing protein n=1 Tax=Rubeoparvulum massiliense TaxID=1631346 RepID=UPI000977EA5D|nr:DUF421 domain-containing protein [Rubeoparvulum massiliense]
MELLTIFFRSFLIFFFVLLCLRLMGKREIGKLSVFDVVVTLMIAELAAIIIEEPKQSIWMGIVPILTMVLLQIIISYISMRSIKVREMMDGTPVVLIENGAICDANMKKMRYNMDDLMTQLRSNQIANIGDVEFAILETSGKLSVFPKGALDHADQQDEKRDEISLPYSFFLPLPLIIDGKVQDDSLNKIQKTRFWLKGQIQEHGVQEFKDVMFATISRDGIIYVDKKDQS